MTVSGMRRYAVAVAGLAVGLLTLGQTGYAEEAKISPELSKAISAGDFAGHFAGVSAWLNQKTPAKVSAPAMKALLAGPAFRNKLAQRQLITKLGVDKIGAFAQAGGKNKEFLTWLLQNTEAMEQYLVGATPTIIKAREADKHGLSVGSLNLWNKIYQADPESKEGIYLRLAIATALNPPGTGNRGAGQAKEAADPVARYEHFKSAHKNKELFTTFDNLSVWDYRQIVSSNASNADLAWAREMINTWRPDLRINQQVVNSTSEVWRRNSPIPFNDTFKNVLAGGGKCGPRSSWSVFICQAFGVPAIGIGQPAHACAAYKAAYPNVEPQPGNVWKVVYGRGWHVSKTHFGSGLDFCEGINERLRVDDFEQVERLRWLASSLTSTERAAAVMGIAQGIRKSTLARKIGLTEAQKAEDAKRQVPLTPEAPPKKVPGVLHIEAEAYAKASEVRVLDCYTGGKQVNFSKNVNASFVEYTVDVPASGAYELTMRAAAANVDQKFDVYSGANKLAAVNVPNTNGLWATTPAVEVRLNKGVQTLRVAAGFQRGIAVRWLELKSKAGAAIPL